jgi:6-phosphogluconolactonase
MRNRPHAQIMQLPDAAQVAEEAARRFVALSAQAVAANGRFAVALSGGSTPKAVHHLLAQSPYKEQVDWQNVHIFWGDERFVSPDDPDSSYRMARETLLDHVPIPAENVYPMVREWENGEVWEAARRYERVLGDFFAPDPPRFDLIFLGMGPDGHTASLFPGLPAVVSPPDGWVTAVTHSPKPPPIRLTLTYKAINQAANVIFLVTGHDKAAMVAHVLGEAPDPAAYPAQGVQLGNGRLLWLLDQEAAQNLPPQESNS